MCLVSRDLTTEGGVGSFCTQRGLPPRIADEEGENCPARTFCRVPRSVLAASRDARDPVDRAVPRGCRKFFGPAVSVATQGSLQHG